MKYFYKYIILYQIMRRKILNEWRDDMDDSPIDIDDDMNIELTSSDMSDEPDLDDDEFALSNITSNKSDYIFLSDEILLKKGYCPYSLEDPFHYMIIHCHKINI